MIEFKACTIRSNNFYSFKNIHLLLKQGKHYRICGPNGGGKTILAETIAGKNEITAGILETNSTNDNGLKDIVKYVPARTFELLFSASDNVFYQQRYYSVANQDVKSVVDYLGNDATFIEKWKTHPHFDISNLFDVKLTGLSNGQLRKLVLLKTMSRQPKVLVLDYPYEGLDTTSRKELNDLLEEFVRELNCSLIIVDNNNTLPHLSFKTLYVDQFMISSQEVSIKNGVLKNLDVKGASENEKRTPILQCDHVCVSYGDKTIIENFSWQVNKGERWLLSGDNGSGKSTILSLIFADHPQAYKNKIYLWGRKRGTGESIWDIKNKISFLSAEMFTFASNSFKNNQKAEQFLYTHFQGPFEMENVNINQLKSNAEKMLRYFDLMAIRNVMFRNLSSGQKQMLLIIRTFLFKQSLILLDEPFQYLDDIQKNRAKCFINDQLTPDDTLIVISHYKDSEFPGITHIKEMKPTHTA